MTQEKIQRINQLAKASKTRDLTAEETQERSVLRQEYLASVRESLTSQLDCTYFVEADGSRQKLEKKEKPASTEPGAVPTD